MSKRVFSKENYLACVKRDFLHSYERDWVTKSDGKVVEECQQMGYTIRPEWLVDVKEDSACSLREKITEILANHNAMRDRKHDEELIDKLMEVLR